MTQKIVLYDTTLRDGTQAEDVNLSTPDKIKIALRLTPVSPRLGARTIPTTRWKKTRI